MRVRLLLAAGVLSFIPALARAQDVPAAVPPQEPLAPVAAQRGGSWEFSFGGGFSLVDKAFNDSLATNSARIVNQVHGATMRGGQLRVTYNLSSHLGLGAGAGVTNGNGALLMAPFVSLTYTFDLNRKVSPFIELGGGSTWFRRFTKGSLLGDTGVTSSYSVFGGLGFRTMLSSALALRVEGRMSYDQFSEYSEIHALNSAAFVGLSLFLGGRPPRDADGDGVPDKRDFCADTPAGAIVDVQGCALDSDTDGVYDGLDLCADTPVGATVDAQGCALDGDRDEVYDGLDRCPDTPADARPVDVNGCPVDTDADGVPDYLDRCPNTPAGVPVDANGCPVDTDTDGVSDNLDRCPNTPANARPVYPVTDVARAGCPVDADADGVPDYLDRCANTAAGTQVDANGCPVARDADRDGVIDVNDGCANTPANTRVDATGCPIPEPAVAGTSLVLRSITFGDTSAVLRRLSRTELDNVAAFMLSAPDARWEIAGYTNNREAPSLLLSRRRAAMVRQYLIDSNVPAASLTAVGYGSRSQAAPNTTAAGRAQNRRVEIKRLQ